MTKSKIRTVTARSATPAPPSPPTVRRARPEDAPGIARVHVEAWRESYAGIVPQSFLDQLDVAKRVPIWERATRFEVPQVHVAVMSGEVVGFADGGPSRSPELAFGAELYAIYLMRAQQGHGLGRALIEAVRRDQREAGLIGMMLWVLEANPTLGFYKRLGGVTVARKTIEIGGAALEELALGWAAP